MAKICYEHKKFSAEKLDMIAKANEIIDRYAAQGFDLTVRQLYYQFVAHDLFRRTYSLVNGKWVADSDGTINAEPNYSLLQGLIGEARLASLIDWDAIVDRSRGLRAIHHHGHPRDLVEDAAKQFTYWKWEDQPNYVEVWVEKDALSDIVALACNPLDVPFFACKGYTSISELHAAAMRLKLEIDHGKTIRIIHLGDHDPSGVDMTRNIKERLNDTFGVPVSVYRVALNMDQIERYNPPPNPAKLTDSRAAGYIERHGEYSWELDALDPSVLARIIDANIRHWMDAAKYEAFVAKEARARNIFGGIHARWNEVVRLVNNPPEGKFE